ncbi:hypothetical protein [Bacillus litorisediminis]|uniref:hypothetical protein n=1 Tax=Bacillus litorisediminis TaxID=2922713 RepID=UPI001FABDE3D|nr:hypothetical protein [Bacillus litorisediminis]
MKKWISIFSVLVVLLANSSSVFAAEEPPQLGPGEWDTLWEDEMYVTSAGALTPTVTSGGGDFQVCVYNNTPGNDISVFLYEVDGSTKTQILPVGIVSAEYGCVTYRDIDSWGDGTDGKPEFQAKLVSESGEYVVVELND